MSDQIEFKWENCSDSEIEKYRSIFDEHRLEKTNELNIVRKKFALKAYDKDVFIGAVTGKISHGSLHISILALDKNYRGKGIGKKLLKQAEEYGIKNDCRFITLETRSYQAPEFYKSQGYKVDFIRDGYIGNTSKIYLSKELI